MELFECVFGYEVMIVAVGEVVVIPINVGEAGRSFQGICSLCQLCKLCIPFLLAVCFPWNILIL
uniref:Uncharacterized protein n=1 Tax=Vitis vinifera TaxID=29760 RepID=F6I5M1_VITVI